MWIFKGDTVSIWTTQCDKVKQPISAEELYFDLEVFADGTTVLSWRNAAPNSPTRHILGKNWRVKDTWILLSREKLCKLVNEHNCETPYIPESWLKKEENMRPKHMEFLPPSSISTVAVNAGSIICTPVELSKYWNGKVICIKYTWPDNDLTVGKVYTVLEGALLDNDGDYYLPRPVTSFEDLIELGRKTSCFGDEVDFIEYKGMA